MDWVQVGLLLVAFLLVLLNGFFVAAEFAIVKVRPTQLESLINAGSRVARTARTVVEGLDDYLAATQLGITLASLGLGWVGERAFARLLEPAFAWLGLGTVAVHTVATALAFTIISFLHVVVGELAPKSLAIRKPLATTVWTAVPLRFFFLLMWPAIRLLNNTAFVLLRVLGIPPVSEAEHAHSAEELEMIVASSARHGLLNDEERKLLENVLEFSERYVHEIMVPRPDMVCLYTALSLEQNIEIVLKHQHTRYPLAVEDKDDIVGMVHVKDLIEAGQIGGGESAPGRSAEGGAEGGFSLDSIRRPVVYVPEVTTIDKLLRVFQRERVHMAVAVDEYGGIAGVVTLEDVLEELVGEIRDEFDVDEVNTYQPRPNGEWIVQAGLLVHEVAERFGFDADDATVDTIGGYVVQLLGRLPKIGDFVAIGGHRVEVIRMARHRVTFLRFRPLPQKGDGVRATTRIPPADVWADESSDALAVPAGRLREALAAEEAAASFAADGGALDAGPREGPDAT